MSEDTQVSIEEQETSQEPELDLELDLNLDDEEEQDPQSSTEDVDALKKKVEELESKNKQLYARLKKPEKADGKVNQNTAEDSDWKRKIEFITTKGRDLDSESIDEVIAYAKGKGISYEEARNSVVIKSFLRVKQAREKVANAIPPSSSRTKIVNGKNWTEMTNEEREKNFEKMMKRK